VIRGLTYTFNQISGHVLSLSSTSDGTRNTGVNKYYISGVETPTLTFIRGSTYTFTQETSTNTGHPIRLSETSNGTHASGSQYTSGWTTTGTPGSSGASSQFIVPANAPNTLYYYCQHHSGMGGASSINVADSNSGIILTYGTHALVANSTVSGEYTIATNFDGTTSNLYVDGDLISQTTPTIASGAKMIKIGEDYNGLIKNLKFWNYAKRFFPSGTIAFHHGLFADSGNPYSDASVSAAAIAFHVYSDTPAGTYSWGTLGTTSLTADTKTTYTWTPANSLTNVDILMIAGGGGGGKQVGGGGGAGGLLHHTNQTLSGQKTIVVGDGGIGGDYTLNVGASNGNNTTFTGFANAIAGGRGASYNGFSSGTGGSGGGGGGYSTTGQTGTSGQGNNGGSGRDGSWGGGGGGGAGAAGQGSPSGDTGGAGGVGVDKSTVFGTTYGDSGWFAGGGGGASSGTNTVGAGGQGGGGQGGNNATTESGIRKAGTKHTGGGGGGTRDGNNFSGSSVSYALSQDGGKGGSGIVLIKY